MRFDFFFFVRQIPDSVKQEYIYMGVSGGFKMGLLLEYNQVFDDKPKDVLEYLDGISQNSILLFCSYFLGNNNSSEFKKIDDLLTMFFSEENYEFKKAILKKCDEIRLERQTELILINIETCLNLFELVFGKQPIDQTLSEAETEVMLFKAVVAQNQIITNEDLKVKPSLTEAPEQIKLAMWPLIQSFRYSEFHGYDEREIFVTQIIKSSILFKFLEKEHQTTALLEELLSRFEADNWKEYLKKFIPLVSGIISAKKEGFIDIDVPKNEDYERSCNFIRKLILTSVDPYESRDFKELRDKPFYEVEEGRFRIIFKLFALEKIFKGLMFILWNINKSLPKNIQVKGDFKSFWGFHFAEKELLYSTLDDIFMKRYKTLTGTQISDSYKTDGGPDYYLRNGNRVFLFEAKDILIQADIKRSSDYTILEPELRKKFYYDDNNGTIKPKAIIQIASCVKNSLVKSFSFDTNYKSSKIEIYPILVIFDKLYNTAGFNILLNYWFKIELNKIENTFRLDISRVKKLTIIDIDTLIFNQDLFREKVITLNETIDDYIEYTTFNPRPHKPYKGIKEAQNRLQNTFIPYSIYLSQRINSEKIRRIPKAFKEVGIEIFE